MRITDIQKALASDKDRIRQRYKAEVKGIFGSYARGDFHKDSDLDLLVDFDDSADLLDAIGLKHFLEDKFGCKVDVVSRPALREEIRDSVFRDMILLVQPIVKT